MPLQLLNQSTESTEKICLDPDFLAESDEESDAEFQRQMISFVENQRKRKLLEDEEEVEVVYSPPSMAYKSISFRVSEDHIGDLTSEDIHQWEDTYHMCQEDFDAGGVH